MISFGKYKNKSYNYVLQNDIKYCNWILTQSTSHKGMNKFINFLKINKNIIIPKGSINCSSLSLYYNDNNDFLNLINDLQIKNITLNLKINDILLPEDIKGIYFDYLIRYKICYEINKEFNDVRCLCFINGHHPYFNNNLYYILKEIVELSYNNMKNFTATNNDIFNVSLCHSLYFNNIKAYEYFNFFFMIMIIIYKIILKIKLMIKIKMYYVIQY